MFFFFVFFRTHVIFSNLIISSISIILKKGKVTFSSLGSLWIHDGFLKLPDVMN